MATVKGERGSSVFARYSPTPTMTVPQTPFTNDTMSKPQLSPLELGQLIGLKEDGSAITAVCTWRELAWAIEVSPGSLSSLLAVCYLCR